MSAPSYESPPTNLRSLEQRLRNICQADGLNEARTRLALAHAVVGQMLPAGAIKGGSAIKLRVGDQASRLTRDLDAVRPPEQSIESYTTELAERLASGWNGFSGRVAIRDPADPPGVPPEYVMHPLDVKLTYESQSFMTVQFELGHDEVGSTAAPRLALDRSIGDLAARLGFPPLAPIPVLAVEHQVAQKLHACTTADQRGGNERAHDLVDLQILVAAEPPDLRELARIGTRLFAARRAAPWPPVVRSWPEWPERYAAAAEGLDVLPLDAAIDWLNALVQAAVRSAES